MPRDAIPRVSDPLREHSERLPAFAQRLRAFPQALRAHGLLLPGSPETKKGSPEGLPFSNIYRDNQTATAFPRGARLILPAFRQRVHTLIFWIFPSSSMRAT